MPRELTGRRPISRLLLCGAIRQLENSNWFHAISPAAYRQGAATGLHLAVSHTRNHYLLRYQVARMMVWGFALPENPPREDGMLINHRALPWRATKKNE